MKKYIIASLALFTLLFYSCQEDKGFTIDGTISDASEFNLFLDRINIGGDPDILTKTKTDAQGHFSIQFPDKLVPGAYSIRIGAKNADFILDGSEKSINITGTLNDMANNTYKVIGSPKTDEYIKILKGYTSRSTSVHELAAQLQSDVDPLISSVIVSKVFSKSPQFSPVFNTISEKLSKTYPDLDFTQKMKAYSSKLDDAYKRMQAREKVKVGNEAPEIAMKGPDGTVHKLSDLKGKVVLLDFWASWCGPCRKANPHVVQLYNKYKDQGFEVFSVSLDGLDSKSKANLKTDSRIKMSMDRQKERWVKAIEQDHLSWENHVSDLKKWESEAARTYNVRQIPKTFLINREGIIAEVNPQFNLEQAIINNL